MCAQCMLPTKFCCPESSDYRCVHLCHSYVAALRFHSSVAQLCPHSALAGSRHWSARTFTELPQEDAVIQGRRALQTRCLRKRCRAVGRCQRMREHSAPPVRSQRGQRARLQPGPQVCLLLSRPARSPAPDQPARRKAPRCAGFPQPPGTRLLSLHHLLALQRQVSR